MSATRTRVAKKSVAKMSTRKPAGKAVTSPIAPAATNGSVLAREKFCKRHNTTHPFEAFAKDKSSSTGYYSVCKLAEAEDRAAK